MRFVLLVLVVSFAVAACPSTTNVPPKAVTALLDARYAKITDFSLEGTAEQGNEKLPYTYVMKQPSFVRAQIGGTAITFDGKALLLVDNDKKTAEKKDLSSYDDAGKLMLIHQAFANFVCEGWRPPLLRPSGFTVVETGGDRWNITVPVDDATVKEQRLVLKKASGELVEKSIVDKSGTVLASTKVTEELLDPTTGLDFPKAWAQTGPGGDVKIHVDKATVNAGFAADLFKTDVPEGYSTP